MQKVSHETCPHLIWGFPICTAITVNVKSLSHLGYGVCFVCTQRPDSSPGVIAWAIIQEFCFVLRQGLSLVWDSPTQLTRLTGAAKVYLPVYASLGLGFHIRVHSPPVIPGFCHRSWGPHSGPHGCTASTSHLSSFSSLVASSLNIVAENKAESRWTVTLCW